MQIDPFCAQIVLYTLSSNIHGAIPSIHTMNILNIFLFRSFLSTYRMQHKETLDLIELEINIL